MAKVDRGDPPRIDAAARTGGREEVPEDAGISHNKDDGHFALRSSCLSAAPRRAQQVPPRTTRSKRSLEPCVSFVSSSGL